MHFENLLGLPLSLARELLEGEPVVVQSAPPILPRGYTPHWGEERVMRVRALAQGQVELLVGRELVGEERLNSNDKATGGKGDARR